MRSTNAIKRARAWKHSPRWLIAILLSPSLALAEPTASEATLAETLFRDGKELMAQKQFQAACPKLAESYGIDPGTGTLLALALCHEGGGQIASAWVEFTDVLSASRDSRPDRALIARDHIAQLEPLLSKLIVNVSPSTANLPGLEVLRDGVRLDRPAWGSPVPVDGGAHVVLARAPNQAAWTFRFDVAATKDQRTVTVPDLASAAGESAPGESRVKDGTVVRTPADRKRQAWGIGVGAAGLVSIGVGTYFGLTAIAKIHDAKAACPNAPYCSSQGPVNTNQEGARDALVSDVALGVGLAALVAGVVLLVTGRAHEATARNVVPVIERTGGAVMVGQAF
jgi:hypothetical protein